MRTALTIAALAAGAALAAPAQAQEDNSRQAGDLLVRARAIVVAPNESSTSVTGVAGSKVGVDNAVAPELDFTYMLTRNVGAELILATTKHSLEGRGSISALNKIGSSWVLPPTLTVQYHFAPEGKVHPYVGAGVNYTIFYSADASASLEGALGKTGIKLDDSFGYAVQAGVDFDISKKFFVNLDVKYIDMSTTARLTSGTTKRTVDVDINPIVAGIGIGTRF